MHEQVISADDAEIIWVILRIRHEGKTENDPPKLPFKAAYMFRPAAIQPLHGVRSKTAWVHATYVATAPLWAVLNGIAPACATTTEKVGRAMIKVAREG